MSTTPTEEGITIKMDFRLFKHQIDITTIAPYPSPQVACPYPPETIKALFSSFLTLTIGYFGFKLGSFISFFQHSRVHQKQVEEMSLKEEYLERFNELIYEMRELVELGKTDEVRSTYSDGFNTKKHILFCFRHIDKLKEDGKFPGLWEMGSRHGLRLLDVSEGKVEVVDMNMREEEELEPRELEMANGDGEGSGSPAERHEARRLQAVEEVFERSKDKKGKGIDVGSASGNGFLTDHLKRVKFVDLDMTPMMRDVSTATMGI